MARPTPEIVRTLRATAGRLRLGARYRWTHMGSCNCGHLAQTVTRLSPAEIHRRALEKSGDWAQQSRDYCPTSGYPMDHIFQELLDLGFTRADLSHLERLSDPKVLRHLPRSDSSRHVDHRRREDVVLYLETWAGLLEMEIEALSQEAAVAVA